MIASILGALILAIFAQSVFHIASRGFYARQDTKTPFIVSLIAIGFSIILSILFTGWGFGPDGLGWAQSIGAVLEMFILLGILNKRSNNKLFNKIFWSGTWRMIIASVITGLTAYTMTKFFPLLATDNSFFVTFPKFMFISFVSIVVYFAASFLLDLEEVVPIFNWINKALFRNVTEKKTDKKD